MVRAAASAALVGALLWGNAALGQGAAPTTAPAGSVGSTVDGGAPAKLGSTTAVGRTKPPGAAAPGTRPDLEEKSRALDRRINRGICTGCK